ncbi:Radical SAM superfamily enzyme [Methanonatronarchaeum thermophilum]|uniref:Radical SAM superfamily enzyme n=1 Tax=Methanonatronarchaeum thermophilum TaxID=1927129 RepID=A0A1Y3GJ58_9EURY|nr:radical SAM protein [Methanonatronarchaeum thermophilum]OUJ19426.1 Radical SAM superfamily enzyme [Methanonatronarchaeum thermophilum]
MDTEVDAVILDGYVDEPGLLGVPPYISPEPRLIAGACIEQNLTYRYITADTYRKKPESIGNPRYLIVHGGVTVPGKYLGGTPLKPFEAKLLGKGDYETFIGGPLARYNDITGYDHKITKDISAYLKDYWNGNHCKDRELTPNEREKHLTLGTEVVEQHPMHPDPLLAEISTYRGCSRYITGGCSFCSEPSYGKPVFREQKNIAKEISKLYKKGIRHYRLGGQSCIFSYKAKGIGEIETPEPKPKEIKKLFKKIWEKCPEIKVLHLDNANPQVIYEHQEKSNRILKILVEYTTPGNVLAFGLETTDPTVRETNNLNTGPEETMKAIKQVNKIGRKRGENGLPKLLPGLNFLSGLKNETPETYQKNIDYLKKIRDRGLWLRRINIRQVKSHTTDFVLEHQDEFKKFKQKVRKEIDGPILKDMIPEGTILKDVYLELNENGHTLARQIATYPILIKIEYPTEIDVYRDIAITDHGYRSLTGIEHPIYLKKATYKQLTQIPGVGKKRAGKIYVKQPKTKKEFHKLFQNKKTSKKILKYLKL